MILLVDIGNTHTVVGISDADSLRHTWRISSQMARTEDEIGTQLSNFFEHRHIRMEMISGVGISSVVPDLTTVYQMMSRKYLNIEPMTIDAGLELGMAIRYKSPFAVGADRLCNAVAGKRKYGCPLIIIDFGTATTFDVVDQNGDYIGGVIAPGIETSVAALHRKAAKLPNVELKFPSSIIGSTTEQSIQAGILFGTVHMIDGICRQIREYLRAEARIIATGGLARIVAEHTGTIETIDRDLSLEGILYIYRDNEKNHNSAMRI